MKVNTKSFRYGHLRVALGANRYSLDIFARPTREVFSTRHIWYD